MRLQVWACRCEQDIIILQLLTVELGVFMCVSVYAPVSVRTRTHVVNVPTFFSYDVEGPFKAIYASLTLFSVQTMYIIWKSCRHEAIPT